MVDKQNTQRTSKFLDVVRGFNGGHISEASLIKETTRRGFDNVIDAFHHIVGSGDIVFAERLDRTQAGEISVDLPCCGVFEMAEGKIKVWRDYFDMATYTKAFE